MKIPFLPGPWKVEDRRHAPLKNIRIVAGSCEVAEVSHVHQRDPLAGYNPKTDSVGADAIDQLGLANAHLIAAAPELYEALVVFMETDWSLRYGNYPSELAPAYAKAREALAKARGEDVQ